MSNPITHAKSLTGPPHKVPFHTKVRSVPVSSKKLSHEPHCDESMREVTCSLNPPRTDAEKWVRHVHQALGTPETSPTNSKLHNPKFTMTTSIYRPRQEEKAFDDSGGSAIKVLHPKNEPTARVQAE